MVLSIKIKKQLILTKPKGFDFKISFKNSNILSLIYGSFSDF